MNERDLGGNIKEALDHGLDQMDQAIRSRLYAARRDALHARDPARGMAAIQTLVRQHPRAGLLLLACTLLIAAWLGLRSQPPTETGDVDILILTGDIPPPAYADWRLVQREDVGPQCLLTN